MFPHLRRELFLLWWLFILATRQALRVAVALCNQILPGRLFHCEQPMLEALAKEVCIYDGSPPTGTGTRLTEKAKAHSPFGVRERRDASRRIPLGDQICVQGDSGTQWVPAPRRRADLRNEPKLAGDGRHQLGHGRVEMHRLPQRGGVAAGRHDVEYGMDRLVAARTQDRRPRMASVSASTTIFMKPSGSSFSTARPTFVIAAGRPGSGERWRGPPPRSCRPGPAAGRRRARSRGCGRSPCGRLRRGGSPRRSRNHYRRCE